MLPLYKMNLPFLEQTRSIVKQCTHRSSFTCDSDIDHGMLCLSVSGRWLFFMCLLWESTVCACFCCTLFSCCLCPAYSWVTNMLLLIALLHLLSWAIHSTSRWAVLLHTTFLHYKTVVLRTRIFLTTLRDRLMEKGPIDDSRNN